MNIPFTSLMSFQSTSMLAINWQFLNAEHIPENQMQKIAAEINFAESTFITKMNLMRLRRKLEYSLQ
jgi:trans-2,3-dihydro-3-hydroxyanthranilate isomerase